MSGLADDQTAGVQQTDGDISDAMSHNSRSLSESLPTGRLLLTRSNRRLHVHDADHDADYDERPQHAANARLANDEPDAKPAAAN